MRHGARVDDGLSSAGEQRLARVLEPGAAAAVRAVRAEGDVDGEQRGVLVDGQAVVAGGGVVLDDERLVHAQLRRREGGELGGRRGQQRRLQRVVEQSHRFRDVGDIDLPREAGHGVARVPSVLRAVSLHLLDERRARRFAQQWRARLDQQPLRAERRVVLGNKILRQRPRIPAGIAVAAAPVVVGFAHGKPSRRLCTLLRMCPLDEFVQAIRLLRTRRRR